MKYKNLGKTGIKVSEMCLGTMTFGTDWGWGADKAESQKRCLIFFLKHGGNFIDTVILYQTIFRNFLRGVYSKRKKEFGL